MPTHRWKDLKHKMSPEAIAQIKRETKAAVLEMDLRELREALGKTQVEMARLLDTSQAEISRLEHREDYLLSTLRRLVEALGGELEVIANFGDRRVRLHAA